jgi:hypothetical protein
MAAMHVGDIGAGRVMIPSESHGRPSPSTTPHGPSVVRAPAESTAQLPIVFKLN